MSELARPVVGDQPPEDFRAEVPVTLDFGDNRVAAFPVLVTGAVTEMALPAMPWKPKKVVLNANEEVLAEVKRGKW